MRMRIWTRMKTAQTKEAESLSVEKMGERFTWSMGRQLYLISDAR